MIEEKEGNNIFKEFFYAIFQIKKYTEFLNNKKGKVFLYLLFIVLLGYIIDTMLLAVPFLNIVYNGERFIQENIPEFELRNGEFYIENSFTLDESGVVIIIDTSKQYLEYLATGDVMEKLEYYNYAMLVDRTSMIVKSDGGVQRFDFDDFGKAIFNNQSLIDLMPIVKVIVTLIFVFLYIFSIIGYVIGALILALCGLVISSFVDYRLTYGQLFMLSIYAKTTVEMVKSILQFFSIPTFLLGFVGLAINCLYLGFAIKKMKDKEIEMNLPTGPIEF